VLFSSPDVASFINENFEPAWVSVRPVPKITIDFGNGKKMIRTVNGNIATYVCTKDGTVVDVLPGIYDRENYIASLNVIRDRFGTLPSDSIALEKELRGYHTGAQSERFVSVAHAAETKDSSLASPLVVRAFKRLADPQKVALQNALIADTNLNETERRPLIHSYLSEHGRSTPDDMKKWLYREVLHADLEDPYLGFDKVLTQTYPFDDSGS
jgi:hypothetical protein